MHAVVVEVNADERHVPQAREQLPLTAVVNARDAGAVAGYWLAPGGTGLGIGVVIFESEDAARAAAGRFEVGAPSGPIEEVTVRSVGVREVLAHL